MGRLEKIRAVARLLEVIYPFQILTEKSLKGQRRGKRKKSI
jgi:hypothetical protein